MFLGDIFKLAAFFQAGDDGFRVSFFFHKDVARLVFLAAIGRGKFVVFGLQLGIGHRVFLLVVRKQLADQQGLARELHLYFEIFAGRKAFLFGFLHEDFARDHFLAHLAFHLRRHGTAGLGHLQGQRVDAGLGNGFAVHDGDVLRQNTLCAQGQKPRDRGSDEKLFLHD